MTDTVADALGLAPLEQPSKSISLPVEITQIQEEPITRDEELEADFKLARDSIRNAIQVGADAIDELVEVAKQSEHPRAYEVLATTINTIAATSEKLLEISKKRQEIKTPSQVPAGANNVQIINNDNRQIVVKTTAEMLREFREAQAQLTHDS